MIGFHYSNIQLNIGDIIISNQDKGQTYDLVWNAYHQVNSDLPRKFGYAYPNFKIKFSGWKYLYIVQSNIYIFGNINHSIYKNMDALSSQSFSSKSIPLKERKEMREKWLSDQACKYFSLIKNINEVEVISDSWEVIKIN